MHTNLKTDFQNRKVTRQQMLDDINEYRATVRIDYFKNEAERINLLKEAGAAFYFTSQEIKASDDKEYRVTSWVFDVPGVMRFFHPDYKYCVVAGYLLFCHLRKSLEGLDNDNGTGIEAVGETLEGVETIQE